MVSCDVCHRPIPIHCDHYALLCIFRGFQCAQCTARVKLILQASTAVVIRIYQTSVENILFVFTTMSSKVTRSLVTGISIRYVPTVDASKIFASVQYCLGVGRLV